MIITAIKRLTIIALFSGVTIAGMTALVTDETKANELASIEVSRAKNVLVLEEAQAVATMTALDASSHLTTLEAAQRAEKAALTHRIEQERQAQLAPIWTASQAVFIALGTGGACLVVLGGVVSYRKRAEPLVSVRGVPIERQALANSRQMFALIEQDQANTALVRVEQARASHQVPHHYSPTTTYAPRYAYEYENTVTNDAQAHETEYEQAGRVPSFSQLLKSGVISDTQDAILYGFDDKQEQYTIKFDELTSTLIFGNSGSGKTTTLANLIGQLALNKFDLKIIDPHKSHKESLSARLAPLGIDQTLIAQSNEQIEQQARHMLALLERAKDTGEDVRTAWILDEVTAVLRNKCASVVQEALEAIAQEGRKYKLVAYAASQATRANRFGDSSVRDSFPIIALHRLRRSALRNVGLTSSDEFARVEKLSVGVFMLDDGKNEPLFLTAPMVNQSDLLTISGTCQPVLSVPHAGNDQISQEPTRNQPNTGKTIQNDVETGTFEAISKQKEIETDEEPRGEEPSRKELIGGASLSVSIDFSELTGKEAKAVLLAKETDMTASAIYGLTGGNKGKVLRLIRDTRALP